jgi:peptidoglycan hydrolase-like protein with peptidoglycan-binding domain
MSNRALVLFFILAWVTATAAGGWVAGRSIESPAEVAARTAPPQPSPILVPVEERLLSTKVVTRGTARYGASQPISVAPSGLKASNVGLITTLPARNAQFKFGDVLLTISGRPVFVLAGKIPAYRDLVPGISGDDVRQLEEALKLLGFDPGPIDGFYDALTGSAVGQLYKSAGFEPFGPTPDQLGNFQTLESSLTEGTKNKMMADSAVAAADLALASARSKGVHSKHAATADLRTALAERDGPDAPKSGLSRSAVEAKVESARAALAAAEAESELAIQAATESKRMAEFDARQASNRLKKLMADHETAKQKLGVQVPLDEIVFLPTSPVRIQEATSVVGNPASGSVLSVTDNEITIHSSLSLEAAPLVKPGMQVLIDEPAVGITGKGIVHSVERTPGTHGVDGYHIYLAVRVGETSAPLDGFSLRLTIPVQSTKGVVTAVPVSAISLASDGRSRIQIENDGKLTYVNVDPGLAADGYVEVVSRDKAIKPGQLVVVGQTFNEAASPKSP